MKPALSKCIADVLQGCAVHHNSGKEQASIELCRYFWKRGGQMVFCEGWILVYPPRRDEKTSLVEGAERVEEGKIVHERKKMVHKQ